MTSGGYVEWGACFLYLSVFFSATLLSWAHAKSGNRFWGLLAIVIPAIFSGARGSLVGEDYVRYLKGAETLSGLNFAFPWEEIFQSHAGEYGYALTVWLLTGVFENRTYVFAVVHGICLALVYCGCVRLSKIFSFRKSLPIEHGNVATNTWWIGYTVFLAAMLIPSFNATRQFLAISVLIFGLGYIFEKKLFAYCLSVLVAMCFHKSAIFALPWYWFIPDKKYGAIVNWGILVAYTSIPVVLPFIAGVLGYSGYFHDSRGGGAVGGAALSIILLIPFLFIRGGDVVQFSARMIFFLIWISYISLIVYGMARLFHYMEIVVIGIGIYVGQSRDLTARAVWWGGFFSVCCPLSILLLTDDKWTGILF